MSGFWEEGDRPGVFNGPETTHCVQHYHREAFLFWLAGWNHIYSVQEQWRMRSGGLPPFLASKTREEVVALGFEIEPEVGGLIVQPSPGLHLVN